MRTGTPGFIGERLIQARKVREMSVITLADILNISKASIYQFQNEETTPNPETLEKLATVLNFPKHFFFRPIGVNEDHDLLFRSFSSATKNARERLRVRFNWTCEITSWITKIVDIPEVNLPDWNIDDITNLADEDIEAYAIELRRCWALGDGPIGNMSWLLENNGIIVAHNEVGTSQLDAVSSWCPEIKRPVILLGTDKQSACRTRFDLGHELGHLVLHRNIKEGLISEDAGFLKLIERQAHRFSGAFNFPKTSFVRELYLISLDSMCKLKPKWKLSVQAMLVRAHDLGMIDGTRYKNIWRNLSRRGWRLREPFDDDLQLEAPYVLSDSIKAVVDGEIMSKSEIRNELALPETEIETLSNLGRGYLSDKKQEVKIIADWSG